MNDKATSLTLLARVRNQQADAWDRLVDLYAPLVHYWCRRSELSPEDTADVFQEVFHSEKLLSRGLWSLWRDTCKGESRE